MSDRLYDEEKVIRRIIKKDYKNSVLPHDELYQIGWVGYLKAIKNFDPKKSKKMTLTYATQHIKYEINKALNAPDVRNVSYTDEVYHDDFYESPEDTAKRTEKYKYIRAYVRQLDDTHRAVIARRYLYDDPMTLEEVAKDLELGSRQRVYQIEQQALAILRRLIDEDSNPRL